MNKNEILNERNYTVACGILIGIGVVTFNLFAVGAGALGLYKKASWQPKLQDWVSKNF